MDAQKIGEFYDDPEKVECEARCLAKAYHLRSLSTDNGLSWRARRWARFIARLSQGVSQSIRERLQELANQPAHPGRGIPELQAPGLIPEGGVNQDDWRGRGLPARPSRSQSSSSSSSSSLSSLV
jgi:hypothetical protein